MSTAYGPKLVTRGIVLCLDAASNKSYPKSGTSWFNLSSSSRNATLVNSPTFVTSNSGYFTFNGTNQYATIPYTAELAPTSQITASCFAYKASWNFANDCRLISKTESGGYQFGFNEGSYYASHLGVLVYANSTYRSVKYSRSLLSNGWHYFCFTFDGRYLKLFVDGTVVDLLDLGATYPIQYTNNNSFVIAAEPNGGTGIDGNYFPGSIANIGVYNVALTDEEILQNFNALKGRYSL